MTDSEDQRESSSSTYLPGPCPHSTLGARAWSAVGAPHSKETGRPRGPEAVAEERLDVAPAEGFQRLAIAARAPYRVSAGSFSGCDREPLETSAAVRVPYLISQR